MSSSISSNHHEETPIHLTVTGGYIIVAIVKLLFEAGAIPDKEDNSALIPVFKSLF